MAAVAVSERIVDMFLEDMGEAITLDKKTGRTVGLEKLGDWKKANAALFKPETEGGDGAGDGNNGGAAAGAGDGGNNNQQRTNRTSNGASRGAGAGDQGGGGREGLPDLTKLGTPAERKQALRDWKRGLRGGGGGGYGGGRASSNKAS